MNVLPHLFRNETFKQQLNVAVMIGVVCFALLSSLLISWQGSNQVRETLLAQGVSITENLAGQSVLALLYGSPDNANEAVDTTLSFPDVKRVEIRYQDGKVLIVRGKGIAIRDTPLSDTNARNARLEDETGNAWRFVAPVLSRSGSSPFEMTEHKRELLGFVRVVQSKDTLLHMQARIFVVNLSISLIFAWVFLLVLRRIADRMTQPITELSEAMARAELGELNVRARTGGPKDIRDMAQAFNSMLAALQERASALRESQADYREVVDSVKEIIFQTDMDGRWVLLNPAWKDVTGIEVEAALGSAMLDLEHKDDRMLAEDWQMRLKKGAIPSCRFEVRFVREDGAIGWMEVTQRGRWDDDGGFAGTSGTLFDITERKKIENELRELNNDFVTLLENTGDFIYFKDKDSRFRFCSQTLANVTGHRHWREMIGKHDLEVFPKDTARIYYEEELSIFQQGKALLNKTDPYYDDQGRRGWVNTNKWPVFGDDGKTVVGIFGISRDITELKEAEDKIIALNRDLERRVADRTEQLETANKELESFSYSVSHDLRTPLRAIDGFSHILLEDYAGKLDEEGKRLLNVIGKNTARMGQLIDDILQFSRTGRLELSFSVIDMEGLVREVVEELLPVFDNGRVRFEIAPIPPFKGDRAMLRQVFINLLSNAVKFSLRNEAPRIQVGASATKDETIYHVRDNGVGFDMQYVGKLFGVFQRLHGVNEFEGTGIGLAIVKRIITRHGGRVWAEGKVNEGTTIYFALPNKEEDHE